MNLKSILVVLLLLLYSIITVSANYLEDTQTNPQIIENSTYNQNPVKCGIENSSQDLIESSNESDEEEFSNQDKDEILYNNDSQNKKTKSSSLKHHNENTHKSSSIMIEIPELEQKTSWGTVKIYIDKKFKRYFSRCLTIAKDNFRQNKNQEKTLIEFLNTSAIYPHEIFGSDYFTGNVRINGSTIFASGRNLLSNRRAALFISQNYFFPHMVIETNPQAKELDTDTPVTNYSATKNQIEDRSTITQNMIKQIKGKSIAYSVTIDSKEIKSQAFKDAFPNASTLSITSRVKNIDQKAFEDSNFNTLKIPKDLENFNYESLNYSNIKTLKQGNEQIKIDSILSNNLYSIKQE